MYLAFKSFHVITVCISLSLFVLRFILISRKSGWAQHPVLKVLPHINDSMLLMSGMALIGITRFIPFTPAAPWLTVKLGCVIGYIFTGSFALKPSTSQWQRSVFFIGALGWVIFILKLAISKQV
ncbi:SirB2 family protein [Photobacterium sagamiensis]|uniref:SirB2 family protein n=1 Tax=Photobacterium sagamiensis TaxID=2910241 RepID=UPI003D0E409E